ncbi:MAG: gliding motility lipoprotein GldD [Bacteroidales bacterium]|nr:gliding motility lipoprotein GldD [Bacteroidales bacterium]
MIYNRINYIILLFIITIFFSNCKKQYTPKPRGYMRIDFPEKEFQLFDSTYPYKFEYPKYGEIIAIGNENKEPFWIDIHFKKFNGRIHISYKNINNNLLELTEDSRTFVYKHTIKANSIEEIPIKKDSLNVYGIFYDIKGNAASSVQFFLTDSLNNFLRGSLYFYNQPNIDSMAPIINFIKKDIEHLIETFAWKNYV